MILHSLEIEGFRCFDRLVRLEGFAGGLNILSGPNGAGKSTLLRALRHLLLDSHSMTGDAVRQAMAPWGRALSPRVRAELEQDGTHWRVEKKFLSGAFARLERLEKDGFRPVAEGRAAETAVREMLLAEAPAKGMAAENHLGLLQVLWTPQGAPLLPEWSPAVRASLQEAFGSAFSSRAADRLTQLVDDRMAEYFTPKGQAKKASRVSVLEQEAAAWRAEMELARTQWQQATTHRETLAELRAALEEKGARLENVELPALEKARQHQHELAAAVAAEREAQQNFDALSTRQRLLQRLEEETLRHGLLQRDLQAATALLPEIEALERELEQLQQSGVDAKAWPDWLRLTAITINRAEVQSQLDSLRAPTAETIGSLRRLLQQIEVKQAALAAASLQVTIEPETNLMVEAAGGAIPAVAGEPLRLSGPQSVSFRLPGVARIMVASANEAAAGLADELERLLPQFEELRNGETVPVLEERFQAAENWKRKLQNLDAELRLLEPRREELVDLSRRRTEWHERPPDLEATRSAWKSTRDRLEAAKRQYDLPALSAAEATARTRVSEIQAQLRPEPPALSLEDAARNLDAAAVRRKALQSANPMPLAELERTVKLLQEELRTGRENAARMDGELAGLQTQNVYSRLATAEERLAECEADLVRQRRKADAIQMLKHALTQAQTELTASLPDQIAECATGYWRLISGEAAPPIRMNGTWRPTGLHVPNAAADLHELSGGEVEQLSFATRLALAWQLAQRERQLAVFDDAFLATDPARADRIVELLVKAAERLQILILTCHPKRYEGLAAAKHFDLEELKARLLGQ